MSSSDPAGWVVIRAAPGFTDRSAVDEMENVAEGVEARVDLVGVVGNVQAESVDRKVGKRYVQIALEPDRTAHVKGAASTFPRQCVAQSLLAEAFISGDRPAGFANLVGLSGASAPGATRPVSLTSCRLFEGDPPVFRRVRIAEIVLESGVEVIGTGGGA